MMLLFLACAVLGMLSFIHVLGAMEKAVLGAAGLDAPAGTGAATTVLWRSASFRDMLTGLVGDKALTETLLGFTPLGLFYGWLAFTFGPWLVVLTSASRVTEDIWGGTVRFVVYRTSRLAWLMGKFAGQSLQFLVALLVSVGGAWLTAKIKLDGIDGPVVLGEMLLFAFKAWIYGMAYLGLVTGLSVYCKSPGIANVTGVIALVGAIATYHLTTYYEGEGWRRLLDVARVFTPRCHYFDLMRPDWMHSATAGLFLVVLALGFLTLGHLRLARRDL